MGFNSAFKGSMICTPHPILFVDKIKKTEMGGARRIYGGEERCLQGFGWGNLREKDHWGDPGVDGRIILR